MTSARVRADGRFRAVVRLRSPGPYHAALRRRALDAAGDPRPAAARGLARRRDRRRSAARSPSPPASFPAAAGSVRVELRRGGRLIAAKQARHALRAGRARPRGRGLCARSSGPSRQPGFAPGPPALATDDRLPLARARRPRAERARARAAAGGAALRASRRRLRLRDRHARGGARLPEGASGCARTGRVDAGLWRRLAAAGIPRRACAASTTSRSTRRGRCCSTSGTARSSGSSTSRPARPATRRSERGASTARSRASTGCSGTRCTSCAASRSTAIRPCPAYPASHGCVRVPMWIAPAALRRPSARCDGHGLSLARPCSLAVALAACGWLGWQALWAHGGDRDLALADLTDRTLGEPSRSQLRAFGDRASLRAALGPASDRAADRLPSGAKRSSSPPALARAAPTRWTSSAVREERRRVVVTIRERTPTLARPGSAEARVSVPPAHDRAQRQARRARLGRAPVSDDDPIRALRAGARGARRAARRGGQPAARARRRAEARQGGARPRLPRSRRASSWLLAHLETRNRGPLSREGLHELVTELLDLTKREVERGTR